MNAVNYILNQYMARHNQNIAMELSTKTLKQAMQIQKNYAEQVMSMMGQITTAEANLGRHIDTYA